MIHEVKVLGVTVEWADNAQKAQKAFKDARLDAVYQTRVNDKVSLVSVSRVRTATIGDQLRSKGY